MTPERRDELTFGDEVEMTEEEYRAGWHWCPDWDYLVIGPEHPEWGPNRWKCRDCGYRPPGLLSLTAAWGWLVRWWRGKPESEESDTVDDWELL